MPEFVKRIVELTQQGYEVCPYISRGSFGLSYTIGYSDKSEAKEAVEVVAETTPVKKAGRPAKN
jgi:hypothetical protein